MKDSPTPSALVDRRLLFIFITIFLDSLGIGLLVPSFPKVVGRFSTDPSTVSEYFGLFVASYALMQFLAAPVLGALSDQWGRKIILLSSLAGAALDYLFMAFAPSFSWLLLGRLISGVTGASMTVASSYIIDISPSKMRTQNFGIAGAAWGLGFIAGPLIGASLDLLSPQAPFLAAAGVNLLTFLFGLLVLPESLPRELRRGLHLHNFNPFQSLLKLLKHPQISVYAWIYFLIFLAGQVLPVNWSLYTQLKFHWTPLQLGLSLSLIGIVVAISQIVLPRTLVPWLGEIHSVTFGLLFYGLCFFLFGIASGEGLIYLTIILFGLTGVATPALQALMSQHAPGNEQGELQGALVSLGSFTSVLAPLIFTPIFVTFTRTPDSFYFPGILFIIASSISFLTLGLWWSLPKERSPKTERIPIENKDSH